MLELKFCTSCKYLGKGELPDYRCVHPIINSKNSLYLAGKMRFATHCSDARKPSKTYLFKASDIRCGYEARFWEPKEEEEAAPGK